MDIIPNDRKIVEERAAELLQFKWGTDITFIKEHFGWRPGKVHAILGNAHGGKSTLVRTLVHNALVHSKDKHVLVWLSEETKEDFETGFIPHTKPELVDKLKILSELNAKKDGDMKHMKMWLDVILREYDVGIVFFDNITTSYFYPEGDFGGQANFVDKLKEKFADNGLPLIVIAHTNIQQQALHGRLIEMNDVRGSKRIVNLSEYFYILESIAMKGKKENFIRVKKHRGHNIENDIFHLEYDPFSRRYLNITESDMEIFNEFWKLRDKLG